jgi:serine/threonine protein kinase
LRGPLTQKVLFGGRYEPTDWIGAGGMQHVYRAVDHLFEREVALKTPKDDSGTRRFQQSAVVSALINNPNVAKTLDYFEEGERLFLVEELVYGNDLASVMEGNLPYLPPSLCARLLHQLAKGLASSHRVNVVHRDLKPSNIMVVGGHKFFAAKITDFGIAKMAEAEIGEWAEAGGSTSSKTVLGAIPYMSPEAIQDFKTPRKESDVWAIGAILYELLSGELPFGTGLKSVPKIIDAPTPQRPGIIEGAQFRNLGIELYEIIARCLSKDPAKRPPAEALCEECSKLCYSQTSYDYGSVTEVGAYTGKIKGANDDILMYHPDNFYGARKVKVGTRVWFGRGAGSPWDRAFPIVRAET